jgi:hypothetical protein
MNECRPVIVTHSLGPICEKVELLCETHGFVAELPKEHFPAEEKSSTVYLLLRRWQDHVLLQSNQCEHGEPWPGAVIRCPFDELPPHLL